MWPHDLPGPILHLNRRAGLFESSYSMLEWAGHINWEELTIWSQSPILPTSLIWAYNSSLLSPPSAHLLPTLHALLQSSTVLPDACCKLGVMWRLSLLGPNLADLGCPVAETGELLDACQHYSVIHCLLRCSLLYCIVYILCNLNNKWENWIKWQSKIC